MRMDHQDAATYRAALVGTQHVRDQYRERAVALEEALRVIADDEVPAAEQYEGDDIPREYDYREFARKALGPLC